MVAFRGAHNSCIAWDCELCCESSLGQTQPCVWVSLTQNVTTWTLPSSLRLPALPCVNWGRPRWTCWRFQLRKGAERPVVHFPTCPHPSGGRWGQARCPRLGSQQAVSRLLSPFPGGTRATSAALRATLFLVFSNGSRGEGKWWRLLLEHSLSNTIIEALRPTPRSHPQPGHLVFTWSCSADHTHSPQLGGSVAAPHQLGALSPCPPHRQWRP